MSVSIRGNTLLLIPEKASALTYIKKQCLLNLLCTVFLYTIKLKNLFMVFNKDWRLCFGLRT